MDKRTNKASAAIACGIVIALLGASALIGWLFRIPRLAQIVPGFTAMVTNTAACFVLSGLAIFLPHFVESLRLKLQTAVGLFLATFATLLFVENFTSYQIFDWVSLHSWLPEGNPYPGRMAPNTAFGFMLTGITLVLMPRAEISRYAGLLRWLSGGIVLVGVAGVLGYFLQLEFLYNWYGIPRMALHSAIGMTVLGIGLWLSWTDAVWNQPRDESAERRRILGTAAFAFTLVAAIAGLSSFTVLQKRMEEQIGQNLSRMHQDRIVFFSNHLHLRFERANMVAATPNFAPLIRRLEKAPNDIHALHEIDENLHSFLPHGFSAIAVSNLKSIVSSTGHFTTDPELSIKLANLNGAELIWKDGYRLLVKLSLFDEEGLVGSILTEQPLPALTQMISEEQSWGETGEMGICGPRERQILCFPQRLKPEVFSIPSGVVDGSRLPMTYALDHETGIMQTRDYRHQQVIAAFGPIGDLGIGMVLKMDTTEIYRPIREQFQIVVPLLLLLIVGGTWLLRLQIGPLVARVYQALGIIQQSEARFRAAAESSLDAFYILESEQDEQGSVVDFRFVYVNQHGRKTLRADQNEIIGGRLSDLSPASLSNGLFDKYKRVRETGESLAEDFQFDPLSTPATWIHLQITSVGTSIFVTSRDITKEKSSEENLLRMAQYDSLTGLPNRALFFDRLHQAIERSKRTGKIMAVMYLDVDRFKTINDSLGHASGDAVLGEFADRLKQSLRSIDTVARLGGDEFTVIAEGLQNRTDTAIIATTIQNAMREPFAINNQLIPISTSIGIACFNNTSITADELLHQADIALYKAKTEGRGKHEIYAEHPTQATTLE